jgi:hypothetical protein
MSILNTDYNSNGGSTSNDNDYEERDSLKLSNYAIISFEITRLDENTSGQYGQSMIADFDDVQVHHGLVYDRFYGDDDDTMKVFGFGEWFKTNEDGTLAEEIDPDFINKRISEKFGGKNYPYEYVNHVQEDDEDAIELGNMTYWLNNTTKNRTLAKVITTLGHDAIGDKDSDNEWLATDEPQLRDDLVGRRLITFFKEVSFIPDEHQGKDDAEDYRVDYIDSVVLDAETGAGITVQNNQAGGPDDTEETTADQSGGSVGGDESDLPDGVPSELEEIIGFMARTGETDAENVERLCDGETDEDYDLDAVIEEIESR